MESQRREGGGYGKDFSGVAGRASQVVDKRNQNLLYYHLLSRRPMSV